LEKDRARIRDATTGELREVSVAELRALPYLPAAELDARLDRQRTIDPDEWSLAERREAAIREALSGDGPTKERVRVAAVALGNSSRAVYRLLARYRISAQTTSLLPRRRGPNKKRRRLGDTRERLIDEAVEGRYLAYTETVGITTDGHVVGTVYLDAGASGPGAPAGQYGYLRAAKCHQCVDDFHRLIPQLKCSIH
jgi:hypothetical protein